MRCEQCDKQLATEADYNRPGHGDDGDGCECAECCALCWGDPFVCAQDAVDWRARALAAEARLSARIEIQPLHLPYIVENARTGDVYHPAEEVERVTIERVAAWLEAQRGSVGGLRLSEITGDLAADLRSGAWKEKP